MAGTHTGGPAFFVDKFSISTDFFGTHPELFHIFS